MSGATPAQWPDPSLIKDPGRAGDGPVGSNTNAHYDRLRSRVAAAARRVRHLPLSGRNGDDVERYDLGNNVRSSGREPTNDYFMGVLSRTYWFNHDLDRALALSGNFVSLSVSVKPSRFRVVGMDSVRVLDALPNSSSGLRMPVFPLVLAALSLVFLLISPGDWVGEIKGALAVLVPVFVFYLKQKYDQRNKAKQESHDTVDGILKYSSDKEKRLEERSSALRQEERAFMHGQMELSRRRGHILGRGYMAIEFANDRLIELLRDNNIEIPPQYLTYQTRSMILGELKELENDTAKDESKE